MRVRIQTDHSLLTNLLPSVVRDYSQLALDNLRSDSALILGAAFHAELAQVLLEAVLYLIDRSYSNVVRIDCLSHAVLDRFSWIEAN